MQTASAIGGLFMILNVDISWPVTSTGTLPIHHQYPLLSAVSRVLPDVHCSGEFGIHSIRGRRLSPGRLSLLRQSALTIRTKVDKLSALMILSGKKLDIAGCPVRLGVPRVVALSPSRSLDCHLVTIKGYMEELEFVACAPPSAGCAWCFKFCCGRSRISKDIADQAAGDHRVQCSPRSAERR